MCIWHLSERTLRPEEQKLSMHYAELCCHLLPSFLKSRFSLFILQNRPSPSKNEAVIQNTSTSYQNFYRCLCAVQFSSGYKLLCSLQVFRFAVLAQFLMWMRGSHQVRRSFVYLAKWRPARLKGMSATLPVTEESGIRHFSQTVHSCLLFVPSMLLLLPLWD